MQIRVGYELIYECPQPTPMIVMLNIHFTRVSDLVIADHIITSPPTTITAYRDGFGYWCSRIVAPPGDIRISTDALINDSGLADAVGPLRPAACRGGFTGGDRSCFCSGAATAKPIGSPRQLGLSSGRRPPGGRASRRSAISSMGISPSATSMPGRPRPLAKPSMSAWVCRDYWL